MEIKNTLDKFRIQFKDKLNKVSTGITKEDNQYVILVRADKITLSTFPDSFEGINILKEESFKIYSQ
jgi:hypothetical protein